MGHERTASYHVFNDGSYYYARVEFRRSGAPGWETTVGPELSFERAEALAKSRAKSWTDWACVPPKEQRHERA